MPNNVPLPPDPSAEQGRRRAYQPLRPMNDVTLSGELGATKGGVFESFFSNIKDTFFPEKLPPLVLTSQPIAVQDRMAVKRDPTSVVISTVLNVGLIAFLLWFAARQTGLIAPTKPAQIVTLDVPPPPPKLPPKAVTMGGGGGQKSPTPVTRGNPPQFAPKQLNPPKLAVQDAKLTPPVTVNVQQDIKMAKTDVQQFGMPNSPLVGMSMGNGQRHRHRIRKWQRDWRRVRRQHGRRYQKDRWRRVRARRPLRPRTPSSRKKLAKRRSPVTSSFISRSTPPDIRRTYTCFAASGLVSMKKP